MADVYAVFGTLLALGIVFPGMLTAWWLLFPEVVTRAEERLRMTPGRTFAFGLGCTALIGLPVLVLFAMPFGPTKMLGSVILMASLVVASFGAAGLAASMGDRLAQKAGWVSSGPKAFLGGALALELAAAFPILGWLIVIPFTTISCLGASLFALLGWTPGTEKSAADAPSMAEGNMAREPQSA
jgi:Na+/melibiose symporter-like transporter